MQVHADEVALAEAYAGTTSFQGLTREQFRAISERARALQSWTQDHQVLHVAINLCVIALLLGGQVFLLLGLPRVFLTTAGPQPFASVLLAALVVGAVHSWWAYSLVVFSIHEGAGHERIFPPRGPVTRLLNVLANNLCRLAGADPVFYAQNHRSHHSRFGTLEDGEFLNFVQRRRFALAFLPYAMFVNFSDFVVHRPLGPTPSHLLSALLSLLYNMVLGFFVYRSFGLPFALLLLVVIHPNLGFYIDRLRQFTEHNLMPLENRDGARSFGYGFWGLLIGGGPWGQPCHLAHHLAPGLAWYQQLRLHRHVKALLTPLQRGQYMIEPIVGFPRLLWRLWTEPRAFAQRSSSQATTGL